MGVSYVAGFLALSGWIYWGVSSALGLFRDEGAGPIAVHGVNTQPSTLPWGKAMPLICFNLVPLIWFLFDVFAAERDRRAFAFRMVTKSTMLESKLSLPLLFIKLWILIFRRHPDGELEDMAFWAAFGTDLGTLFLYWAACALVWKTSRLGIDRVAAIRCVGVYWAQPLTCRHVCCCCCRRRRAAASALVTKSSTNESTVRSSSKFSSMPSWHDASEPLRGD